MDKYNLKEADEILNSTWTIYDMSNLKNGPLLAPAWTLIIEPANAYLVRE
jgi:hypothetical protein